MASKSKCVAIPSKSRGGYESVSVRPIDNGFIVSRYTDKGQSEVYSPTKPKIEIPATKGVSIKSTPSIKPTSPAGSMKPVARAAGAGKKR